jgi:hypothetical protein
VPFEKRALRGTGEVVTTSRKFHKAAEAIDQPEDVCDENVSNGKPSGQPFSAGQQPR